MVKIISCIIASLLFFSYTNAQDSTVATNESKAKKSYFRASLNYLSNAVFFGRKDSVRVPYITPGITYNHKSGAFISASASILNSQQESRIDLMSIGAGYNFKIASNLLGGIYADKYFYNTASVNVRSDLTAAAGAYAFYNPNKFGVSAGVDLLFSDKADATANLGFFCNVNLDQAEKWSLMPSVTAYAGTQNFYTGFAGRSTTGRRSNSNISATSISQSSRFSILAYELSVPLSYDAAKWGISFAPVYAMPVNPVTFKNNLTGSTVKLENLQNSFYFDIGVYFKF